MNHVRVVFSLWVCGVCFALMPIDALEDHFFGVAIVLAAVAACGLVWGLRNVRLEVLEHELLMIGAAFWVLALISVGFCEVQSVSFMHFCFFSVFPISAIVFASLCHRPDMLRFALYSGAVFFAVLSIGCLIQFFVLRELLLYGLARWPLTNPNSMAGLLSLGFFGALGVMVGAQSRVQSNVALVVAILALWAVFTTGSRGAMGAFVLVIPFFLLWNRAFVRRHLRCLGILAGMGLLGFAGLSAFESFGHARPFNVVASTLNGQTPLLWSRPEIWASTLEIARDYFWTGTGIGTFFLYYPEYRGADYNSGGWAAHNDPLQFWAEMGAGGIVLFYVFIGVAIWRCWTAVRALAPDDPKRILILTPFCALGAMIAHTHVSFHFNILSILFVAGAMLGVWFWAIGGVTLSKRTNPSYLRTYGVLGVLVAGVFGFSVLHSSDIIVTKARASLSAGDTEAFIRDINLAGWMSGQTNPRALASQALLPLSALEQQGSTLSKTAAQKYYDDGMQLLDAAERHNHRLAPIYLMRAQLMQAGDLHLSHRHGDAVQAELEKGLLIHPMHLETRMALVEIHMDAGRNQAAYRLLKEGLVWPYQRATQVNYYRLLAAQALSAGDHDTHKRAMDKMRALFVGVGQSAIPQ